MLTIIPFLAFVLLFCIYKNTSLARGSLRTSFLFAFTTLGCFVFLSTEVLSLFNAVTFSAIGIFWMVLLGSSLFILFLGWKQSNQQIPESFFGATKKAFATVKTFSLCEKVQIVCILFILFLTAITALIAPPNNWDSMTYHMSRVAHWIQNQNISFYQTNIPRQLVYPPFAEYMILHLQLLSHSDRFANMIQWFSFLICITAVSLIAKSLRANRKTQIVAAVIAATIPMAILQSSSTQNDLTVSAWALCFVFFLLEIKANRNLFANSIFSGIAFGLALLTKGSGYLLLIPFLLLFFIYDIFKSRKNSLKSLFIILLIGLIINSGYLFRMSQAQLTVVNKGEDALINKSLSPKFLISNVLQNIALHLNTPIKKVDSLVEQGIYSLHSLIGINLEDFPKTFKTEKFYIPTQPFHEDQAGNLIHCLLIILCFFLLFIRKNKPYDKYLKLYLILIIFMPLAFSALLKWSPYHSRYHLPIFLLWAPALAIIIERSFNKTILCILAGVLILYSLPWTVLNQSRPILKKQNIFNTKRADQYFANRPYLNEPYTKTTDYIKENKLLKLGLSCGLDDWEYPFWAQLKINQSPIRLEHVKINSVSPKPPKQKNFMPELIVDLTNNTNNKIQYRGAYYVRTRKFYPINIFVKETPALAQDNLKDHFKKMFTLNFMASSLPFTNKNYQNILLLRKEEYNEASLIDTEELKRTDPFLANHFINELLPGLTYRIMGYATKNREKKALGEALISQWNTWVNQNKTTIKLLLAN